MTGQEKRKLAGKLLAVLTLVIMYVFFFINKDYFYQISTIDGISSPDFLRKRILFVTLLFLAAMVIAIKDIKLSEKQNKIAAWMTCLATPLVSFFALEYANIMEHRILWQVVTGLGKKRCLMSVAVILLLVAVFLVITNSTKLASVIVSVFIGIFGVGCYFVYSFRGIPFLASDLTIMETAFNVMADYEYTLGYEAYVLIFVTIVWCIFLCKFTGFKAMKWKVRLGAAVLTAVLVAVSVHTLVYTSFLKEKVKVSVNTFMPQKSYAKSGSILVFIRSIQYIMVEKPEGYHLDKVEEIASEYRGEQEGKVKPNVIVIMDEAFADLQSLADFSTNQPVMPFVDSLKEDTVKGEMYVSVFGGQTANTEYEVLTGNSKAFLPASSTPYQLFIKEDMPSLTTKLKENGYQGNIAMHPYRPNGYNRQRVYPLLGFDEFLSLEDFENPKLVRKFVSDESDFERIIQEYEESKAKSDAPFYLFNVTMQNHSSYTEDFDNLPKDITITDPEYQDDQAERYLNLIHLSDQALEKLVNYYQGLDDPTVIVFFGDHEPGIHEAFYKKLFGKASSKLTDEELMEKYKVPFIIWANYDIEEQEDVVTSANYLSALMAQSTDMEMTGYEQFLMDTWKKVPVLTGNGYFGEDGKFYKLNDVKSPYYEELQKYSILQYNTMFDSGNRIGEFFD